MATRRLRSSGSELDSMTVHHPQFPHDSSLCILLTPKDDNKHASPDLFKQPAVLGQVQIAYRISYREFPLELQIVVGQEKRSIFTQARAKGLDLIKLPRTQLYFTIGQMWSSIREVELRR